MNSYISIIGMYEYAPDLFDDLQLPYGAVKSTAINAIMLKCADLELLYPDAAFMKSTIGYWSEAYADTFQKMYDTTTLHYNPIWNKDGEYTETMNTTGTDQNINSVKGFNSDAWSEAVKNNGNTSGTLTRTRKEQGNIGVTTTQQMIKEEREVSNFNFYDYLADRFKEEFCIMIY